MTYLGKNIQLTGITHRGKNLIRKHGNIWTVLAETDHVLHSPDNLGLRLFIVPIGGNWDGGNSRWVLFKNDIDFTITLS